MNQRQIALRKLDAVDTGEVQIPPQERRKEYLYLHGRLLDEFTVLVISLILQIFLLINI